MKKYILILILIFIFNICISLPAQARLIRNPFTIISSLREAIDSIDENPRYKNLIRVWRNKVGENIRLEKIAYMVNILNFLEDFTPLSYHQDLEEKIKENYPSSWQSLVAGQYEIESNPSRKLDIVTKWLWQELTEDEKNIFRADGTVLKINPKKLLYEYILSIDFDYIFREIYNFDNLALEEISNELNKNFEDGDRIPLREKSLQIAKYLYKNSFDINILFPKLISLSSRNADNNAVEFGENISLLYNIILQLNKISIEPEPILTFLDYHSNQKDMEESAEAFRKNYLEPIIEYIFYIKDLYSLDLVGTCLETSFQFSYKNGEKFQDNLEMLENLISEFKKNHPFSQERFLSIIADISNITKEDFKNNLSAVLELAVSLNNVNVDPNRYTSKLLKTILSISFEDEKLFQAHIKTICDFFLEQLKDIKIPFEYYLIKWVPEFAKKLRVFVKEEKLDYNAVMRIFRYNFILSLKDLLVTLLNGNIHSQSLAGYILEKNLEFTKTHEDFERNIKITNSLIKTLTSKYSFQPSFLRYLIDEAISLASDDEEEYRLNLTSIEFLTKELNSADINLGKASNILKNLIKSAELTANNDSKIFRGNMRVIEGFIHEIIPYKEALEEEKIYLELILENEVIKIARESNGNYLKFRQELRYLKERLIGS